jgi:hypothetical protein
MAVNRGLQCGAWLLSICASAAAAQSLEPFGNDRELARYLETLEQPRNRGSVGAAAGGDESLEMVVTTGSRSPASITNNQTAGVDEGGIVKLVGDYLVVLRRGRLFTVSLTDERMQPVSWIDAYPPGVDADNAWYDEMLVYRDRIVVIGYSYESRATEVNLFRIDTSGGLRFESSYLLRSTDYYSASNYASRLIGDQLVFYTALPATRGMDSLPAMFERPRFARLARPREGTNTKDVEVDERFIPITSARRVYRPPFPLEPDYSDPALHTVTRCDLSKPALECRATSVFGSYSQVFYVSGSAVYVWTALNTARVAKGEEPDDVEESVNAFVYRLPLNGGAPMALPAAGMPQDQFSFLEEGRHLNVLVVSNGRGNWMWNTLESDGSLALLRVQLSEFGNGRQEFDADLYRPLPTPDFDGGGSLTNRFVGRHLLYGMGDSWGPARGNPVPLHLVDIEGAVHTLQMPHSIDRIDVLGDDAIVLGTNLDDELVFSGVRLRGRPRLVQSFTQTGAEQGELRSHGFFYDRERGVFGLPVRSSGSGGGAHLKENSAGITFIANVRDRFDFLGVLQTEEDEDEEDGCVASCVDWYGNARPLFIGNRVFALLGYELIEGKLSGGRIREKARVGFAPYTAEQ